MSTFFDLQLRQVRYQFLGYNDARENVTQRATLTFFNPKAGVNWNFRPKWEAYLFFGVGNHEPNRDDYTESTPAQRPLPERMYDWEAGLKTKGDNWNLSLNAYWMQYKNQLVLNGRINDVGAYTRVNVPDSYRAGLELEGVYQIIPALRLQANITGAAIKSGYLSPISTIGTTATRNYNISKTRIWPTPLPLLHVQN